MLNFKNKTVTLRNNYNRVVIIYKTKCTMLIKETRLKIIKSSRVIGSKKIIKTTMTIIQIIRITKLRTEIKTILVQMICISSYKHYKIVRNLREQRIQPIISIHLRIKVQVKTRMICKIEMKT